MRKKHSHPDQLSLFETPTESDSPPSNKEMSSIDRAMVRFEQNPNMNQEEYKRWIKHLIRCSLRSME